MDTHPTAQREPGTTPLMYMPQLDGLRAFAVTAVIIEHYHMVPDSIGMFSAARGVHLFFVLSGFLITRILLGERENVATTGISRGRAFRQFYIRRVLRIFPLYYLIVFAGIIGNARNARPYAPWLLTYTLNWKMAAQGYYADTFAHFWTLAVEEQYYLIWPWIILLVPRRRLPLVAVITICIAPVFRLCLLLARTYGDYGNLGLWGYIGTPGALDKLGIGSLIAILMSSESTALALRRWMKWMVPVVAFSLAVILYALNYHSVVTYTLFDTAAAAFFGWLIYTASSGFTGITGKILSATPLVYVGKISYGVYVYHPYVPAVLLRVGRRFGFGEPMWNWRGGLLYMALTILVATLSWYMFEHPINQLKRKFPYPMREDSR